jgi:hypothetical protein
MLSFLEATVLNIHHETDYLDLRFAGFTQTLQTDPGAIL